jgi:hypothetical protein
MEKSDEYYKMKYFKYKAKYEGLKAEIEGGTKPSMLERARNYFSKNEENKVDKEKEKNDLRHALISDIIKLSKDNLKEGDFTHVTSYNKIKEFINKLQITANDRKALLKRAEICQKMRGFDSIHPDCTKAQ